MHPTLEYLYSLERFGIKLGLDTINALADILNHPEKTYKTIHVAGTNGKGSTCAFIASALQKAGYCVGLYTSPHLIRFNERIKVNGIEISDKELIKLTELIKRKIKKTKLQPTFFEFTTAIAFLYFAYEAVDYAVIEVGMGGRLDATNIIQPELAVITSIDLEHTEHLGDTIGKIAFEKAGIIKSCPTVTAEAKKEALALFEKKCKETGSRLIKVQDLIKTKIIKKSLIGISFSTTGIVESEFSIPLIGDYQVSNACTAIVALKELNVKLEHIKQGLADVKWSGRLQVCSKKPLVIVDGSHNVAGMKYLKEFVKYNIQKTINRKTLIIGIKEDKKSDEMVSLIVPLFEEVIVSEGTYKPKPAEELAKEISKYNKNVKVIKNVKDALKEALKKAEQDDFILVTGSLYLIGDALNLYIPE